MSFSLISTRSRTFQLFFGLAVWHDVMNASFGSSSSHRCGLAEAFVPAMPPRAPRAVRSLTPTGSADEPWRLRRKRRKQQWQRGENYDDSEYEHNKAYLHRATMAILQTKVGSLTRDGSWHQLPSLLSGWMAYCKSYRQAPVLMEALLKRLLDEEQYSSDDGTARVPMVEVAHYNMVLDGWACAALFDTENNTDADDDRNANTAATAAAPNRTKRREPRVTSVAAQRAWHILLLLQKTYEANGGTLRPNEESFDVVLHATCRTQGAVAARRLLAWMEYLAKTGRNPAAQPTFSDYVMVLDTYATMGDEKAGVLAEGFLRHMRTNGITPNTLCYNIAIKAWTKNRRGRSPAEHADRILLETMQADGVVPDVVTYAKVVSAWAASGMKHHAVNRAEELVRRLESEHQLEPNRVVLNALMSAWVKAKNPAAVQRTREILNAMEACERVQPDRISYNTHLHALSMHGKAKGNVPAAIQLLRTWRERYDSGALSFGPNTFSYNLLIDAHCRANQPHSAVHVLRDLIRHPDLEPDTFSFNQVLSVLSKEKADGGAAADTARGLLEFMESSSSPRYAPDTHSYGAVIQAYASSGRGSKEVAEQAQALLDACKRQYEASGRDPALKPTSRIYNAVIHCWAKSGEGTYGARRAEALLEELQRYDDDLRPNLVTYNGVVNAWARSGTRCCGLKAETYLDRMWQLYQEGHTKLQPDDFTYNTVINAISKSQHRYKAQKALRVLRRMDKLYTAGKQQARPNEVTYTAVLNSCAFPVADLDSNSRKRTLDTALFTLNELQSSPRYGKPNQVTYGTFIKAVANLLHDDDDLRRKVIERVFKQCCRDGQVGEMVLNYMRKAAPADLYRQLLPMRRGPVTVQDIPQAWRCNVQKRDNWRQRRKKP